MPRGEHAAPRGGTGQNVDFKHLIRAESSKDYVALVTAQVVEAEYFKKTSIYQVKNLSVYARQLKVLEYFKVALWVCTLRAIT